MTPERAPELMIKLLIVLVDVAAEMAPADETEKLVPLMTFVPPLVPRVRVPLPFS